MKRLILILIMGLFVLNTYSQDTLKTKLNEVGIEFSKMNDKNTTSLALQVIGLACFYEASETYKKDDEISTKYLMVIGSLNFIVAKIINLSCKHNLKKASNKLLEIK